MSPLSRTATVLLLAAGALLFYSPGDERIIAARSITEPSVSRESAMKAEPRCPNCTATTAISDILPVRRQDAWRQPVSEPAFAAFRDWTDRWLTADASGRKTLEVEGVRLATQRRREMADKITSQPERALALTVPHGVRKHLPGSITALLEEPVNSVAEYQVLAARPVDGGADAITPVAREAVIGGERYAVFTFGDALDYVSKSRVPVNGISLPADAATNPPPSFNGSPARLLALDPSPARALDDDEAQEFLTGSDKTPSCPTSGEAVTKNETPGIIVGGCRGIEQQRRGNG